MTKIHDALVGAREARTHPEYLSNVIKVITVYSLLSNLSISQSLAKVVSCDQ